MATEHTLTLKAALDTSEAQAKLNQLEQSAGPSGPSGSSGALDKLSKSIKGLRRALGGAVISRSFLNLAKSAELFGEKSEAVVSQVQSSMNSLFGAMATGNVAVIAFTAALEALNIGLAKAQAEAAEAMKRDAEEREAYRRILAGNDKLVDRARQGQIDRLVASGSESELTAERDRVAKAREDTEKSLKQALYGDVGSTQFRADKAARLQETLSRLDKEFKELNDAVEKARKAEEKRVSDLSQARDEFDVSEADRAAKQTSDFEYFKKVMDEASTAMLEATTADQFKSAASRYASARDYLEDKKPKELTAADWAAQLQQLALAASSSFGAAGFGMGENSGMDMQQTISNQIDVVIRCMQDILRRDLEVVNQASTL